jgi:hypothetical protein
VRYRGNLLHRVTDEFNVHETTGLRADQRITVTQLMSVFEKMSITEMVEIAQSVEQAPALDPELKLL